MNDGSLFLKVRAQTHLWHLHLYKWGEKILYNSICDLITRWRLHYKICLSALTVNDYARIRKKREELFGIHKVKINITLKCWMQKTNKQTFTQILLNAHSTFLSNLVVIRQIDCGSRFLGWLYSYTFMLQ